MKTYSEKLKDPRWQKKRLEVLNRDSFKCTLCEDEKTELHVHHSTYTKNPWDSDIDELKTLCKNCHSFLHGKSELAVDSIRYIQDKGFSISYAIIENKYIASVFTKTANGEYKHILCVEKTNPIVLNSLIEILKK